MVQAIAGQPGVDLIAFETVPCLKELRAISRLLRTESFGVPAWVSCSARSCTATSHGEQLIGESPFTMHEDRELAIQPKKAHSISPAGMIHWVQTIDRNGFAFKYHFE